MASRVTAPVDPTMLFERAKPRIREHFSRAVQFFDNPVFLVVRDEPTGLSRQLLDCYFARAGRRTEAVDGTHVLPDERRTVLAQFAGDAHRPVADALTAVPADSASVLVVVANTVTVIRWS